MNYELYNYSRDKLIELGRPGVVQLVSILPKFDANMHFTQKGGIVSSVRQMLINNKYQKLNCDIEFLTSELGMDLISLSYLKVDKWFINGNWTALYHKIDLPLQDIRETIESLIFPDGNRTIKKWARMPAMRREIKERNQRARGKFGYGPSRAEELEELAKYRKQK